MIFIDLHTDMPLKLLENKPSFADCTNCGFEGFLQSAAFWFDGNEANPKEKYFKLLKATKIFIKEKEAEIFSGKIKAKRSFLLSVENGGFLAEFPDFLEQMAKDNIKALSLAWNEDNLLAGGCFGKGGLTEKGRDIILKMNELGICLDISHLNEKSALEALNIAKFPLATHSNCKAVLNHKRNLSDEILLKIKEKKGLVGLCFYPEFLGDNVYYKIRENVEHLCSLGMEENIAIGSDFDGAKMSEKLSNPKDIWELYGYLFNMGIKKSVLSRIFYKNAIAFFDRMCQN